MDTVRDLGTDWIDDVICDVVKEGGKRVILHIRKVIEHESYKTAQAQGRTEIIIYFIRTLQQVLYPEIPLDDGRMDAIEQIAGKIANLGYKGSDNDQLFPQVIGADSNKIREWINDLMAAKLYDDVLVYAVEFKLFQHTIGLFVSQISKVSKFNKSHSWLAELFKFRNHVLQAQLDHLDAGGSLDLDPDLKQQSESSARKVFVEENGMKKVENGNFYLNDLQAGFQISKNGGRILIKNGLYSSASFFDVKLAKDAKQPLEIIGESASDCCVCGSLRISSLSDHRIVFRNIKFEVGDSAESTAAINIFSGNVVFENCIFECFVNTAIYIHGVTGSSSEMKATMVSMTSCFLEGLQSCQRAISIEKGSRIVLEVSKCLFNEMYSVLSWFEPGTDDERNKPLSVEQVNITLRDSFFKEIQDGVRIASPQGCFKQWNILIERCGFNLVLYADESPSSAVDIASAGLELSLLQVTDCMIELQHTQGVGIKASLLSSLSINGTIIQTDPQLDRRLSTSICVDLSKTDKIQLENNRFTGSRIGLNLCDCSNMSMVSSAVLDCSVGVYYHKGASSKSQLSMDGVLLESTFNGILLEDELCQGAVDCCTFSDVLLPLMSAQSGRLQVTNCNTRHSSELLDYIMSDSKVEQLNVRDDKSSIELAINRDGDGGVDSQLPEQDPDSAVDLQLHVQDSNQENFDCAISDEDLKLYLIVERNLPYQVSVDRKSLKNIQM